MPIIFAFAGIGGPIRSPLSRLVLGIATAWLLVQSAAAQDPPWCLRDKGTASVEFSHFRVAFERVLADRDVVALRALSADSIGIASRDYTFDEFVEHVIAPIGGDGIAWWQEAQQAMSAGGVFFRDRFCAPLVACESTDAADPMDVIVLQRQVDTFARPAVAPRLGTLLACERARLVDSIKGWVALRLPTGETVWTDETGVRPLRSSTLQFRRAGTSWQFEAFAVVWP